MCFKGGCILTCDSIISSHIFDVQSAEEQTCTKEIKILPLLLSLVFIRWKLEAKLQLRFEKEKDQKENFWRS